VRQVVAEDNAEMLIKALDSPNASPLLNNGITFPPIPKLSDGTRPRGNSLNSGDEENTRWFMEDAIKFTQARKKSKEKEKSLNI
jgi:hypothetical protein